MRLSPRCWLNCWNRRAMPRFRQLSENFWQSPIRSDESKNLLEKSSAHRSQSNDPQTRRRKEAAPREEEDGEEAALKSYRSSSGFRFMDVLFVPMNGFLGA